MIFLYFILINSFVKLHLGKNWKNQISFFDWLIVVVVVIVIAIVVFVVVGGGGGILAIVGSRFVIYRTEDTDFA